MKKNVKRKLIYFGLFTIIFLVILFVKHSFDKNNLLQYKYWIADTEITDYEFLENGEAISVSWAAKKKVTDELRILGDKVKIGGPGHAVGQKFIISQGAKLQSEPSRDITHNNFPYLNRNIPKDGEYWHINVYDTSNSKLKKKELDVFINVKGHKEGNSVIFDIDTNLPDETVLMLTLSKGDYNTEESFTGQEKVTVKDGKADSEGFSNKGEALGGEYDLSVSMSLPSTQEDSVREVIGENGEYMTGSLVQKSDISGDSYLKAMFEVKVDSDVVVNPTEDYLHTTFRNEETEDTVDEVPSDTVSNTKNNKEFIKHYETDIVVAASMSLEKFISGYKMSLAPQRWILAKFDDKDAVIGMTDIKYNNQEGKYIYVGTLNFDDSEKVVSATPHYIV